MAPLLGKTMGEVYRDRPDLIADHERCFVEQSTFQREFVYRLHSTGESRQLAVTYVFVPPDLVVAYGEDLTARKADEAALRASEGRYRELLASAERQAQELLLLDRVRTALARELDPDAVVRVVVVAIAATFGYTQVSLYLCAGDAHVLQHQIGYDRVRLPARVPATAGVSGRAVAAGRALLVADVASEPAFLGAIDGLTSAICVPLSDAGQAVGVLNVESVGGCAWTRRTCG